MAPQLAGGHGGTCTWAPACLLQPAILLPSPAWAAGCPAARSPALTDEQDSMHYCFTMIPHILLLTLNECPQPPSLCRTSSWFRTKSLGREVLSSPVFKSSSAHGTSPDTDNVHLKGSFSFLGRKGHEYQSLSNSNVCFFLIRKVKCLWLFSESSALLWGFHRCSVSSCTPPKWTGFTIWGQVSY